MNKTSSGKISLSNLNQIDNVNYFKTPSPRRVIEYRKNLKRSSSDSKLSNEFDLSDQFTSSSSLFKTKSTKNLNDSKLIKSYVKNQNPIRIYDSVPPNHMPPLHITNQDEVKKKFFESKIPPVLKFKADNQSIQSMLTKHSKTNFQHFFKAKNILDTIKSNYSNLVSYFEANFGKKISSSDCVDYIGRYLNENKISGDLSISFAPGLTCSGRITSYMPNKNDPKTRRFSIWINDGDDNHFLRKKGIISLCDHEIGTHYIRAYNDGQQIWFNDRKKYGLRETASIELLRTEEGIAALHTLMNANIKYLYLPALLYYLACMADRMTFEQLYNHMEKYIEIPEERWKLVTRVKRGISDPHQVGCYSRDQAYFEGAIEILENLENINFVLLMSGKICLDELDQVKRIAKLNSIKLPKFMKDLNNYKEKLREIGITNGIIKEKERIFKSFDSIFDNQQEDLKFYKKENLNLFNLNSKSKELTSIEIKRFINREIVTKTKSTVDHIPNNIHIKFGYQK